MGLCRGAFNGARRPAHGPVGRGGFAAGRLGVCYSVVAMHLGAAGTVRHCNTDNWTMHSHTKLTKVCYSIAFFSTGLLSIAGMTPARAALLLIVF